MSKSKQSVDIGCLEAIESLYAWLDGELDDIQITEGLENHLCHCKSCWSRAKMERSLTEHIKRSVSRANDRGDSAPDTLKDRLGQLLEQL